MPICTIEILNIINLLLPDRLHVYVGNIKIATCYKAELAVIGQNEVQVEIIFILT